MTDQFRSQITGLALGAATAIGCVAYERLVKSCSFFTVGLIVCLSYLPFALAACWFSPPTMQDAQALWTHRWFLLLYLASGVTSPLWYTITRRQSVMVGGVYEIKYILILTLFYICFGKTPISANTVIGIVLAVCSVYFISK